MLRQNVAQLACRISMGTSGCSCLTEFGMATTHKLRQGYDGDLVCNDEQGMTGDFVKHALPEASAVWLALQEALPCPHTLHQS